MLSYNFLDKSQKFKDCNYLNSIIINLIYLCLILPAIFFYDNGSINELLAQLREKNLIYEKDDATWFRASALGKEKDRVYIKSSGEPTYRVPDTAYHRDKINRKFD